MELWIRSQDKNALRRINTSLYLKQGLSNYPKGDVWFIVTGGDDLGEYETKERALEILDEIQKQLEPSYVWMPVHQGDEQSHYQWGIEREKNTIIYEMPKE